MLYLINKRLLFGFVILSFCLASCAMKSSKTKLHVVFVFGDEEYRSEESMPMLAKIVQKSLNAKVSLCYPVDSLGFVNPNVNNNIEGLEALKTADLMVLFCRWRELPKAQAQMILDYVESGRPIVGFRTSTHTFKYLKDSSMFYLNDEWPHKVLGQQWITHHGHFDDGANPLTSVFFRDKSLRPILRGVTPFDAYSWLYHVDGGKWKLNEDCTPILMGKSLKSKHEMDRKLDEYPLVQPVAWTKTYQTKSKKESRIFFTTLGHPFDFKIESMRKLAVNGIYWALNLENQIPPEGSNVEIIDPYQPSNSGFGELFKKGQKPIQLK